jgi:predicted transcriptional regulator
MSLYGFILVLCALVGYVIYILASQEQKQTTTDNEKHKLRSRLIEKIYSEAHNAKGKNISTNTVSKVFLMESMNMKPAELKNYIYQLTSHGIVEEQQDTVTITPFGIEFFNMFGKEGGWQV